MTEPTPLDGNPASAFRLADADVRKDIGECLDETLFVEASAGTGKTTSLVERVVNLAATGRATLNRVAAITFTEAAAAELRDRIRSGLEAASADDSRCETERDLCRQGIADLDQADICTLHAFAGGLLRERPLEVGLPPVFETSDEIVAGIKFNEKWDEWVDRHLDEETELGSHLALALTLGMAMGHLKDIARAFHHNYSDLDKTVFDEVAGPAAARELVEKSAELERLCDFSRLGAGDALYVHVQDRLRTIRRLEETADGSPASYRLMMEALPLRQNRGLQGNWRNDPESFGNAGAALKRLLAELDEQVRSEIELARRAALTAIIVNLREFVLYYARQRKKEGRAEFHDLLVWARDLLRDNLAARDYFRGRYSHLLIDEAQDTDPIQAEIVMLLAESAADAEGEGTRATDWREVTPEPGKLFVVGDPKQSIYRFRRADVEQMQLLQHRLEQAGGRTVKLTQNFRSQKPVVGWVNRLFERWMAGDRGMQATYEAMWPRWNAETDGFGPRVWKLGDEVVEASVAVVRRQEAEGIGELLRQVVGQPWQTLDLPATAANGVETYRAARYADICILVPRRTGLDALEQGLQGWGIPYRLESGSLLFETQEIRDLLNCLKAVDDPSDQIAVAAALRSPAFGCNDADLLRHLDNGGSFNYLGMEAPESGAGSRVEAGLATLAEFHRARLWESTAALIDRFIRERELMEAATGDRRMREQWRRYRYLVEQAGRFASAGGGMLRAFLDWVDDQIREGARVTESPTAETDEDAVRIMTVHGAKGLEFPVVILAGINSSPRAGSNPMLCDRQRGRVEVGVGSQDKLFATAGFEELAEREKEMEKAEEVRLMYVATTRARDHLVLSLRRPERGKSLAGVVSGYMAEDGELWDDVELNGASLSSPAGFGDGVLPGVDGDVGDVADESIAAFERWERERREVITKRSRPSLVAATALSEYGKDEEREPDAAEPWRRGRAGTAMGRAVHAVLQSIDLKTGEGVASKARAQAAAEGLPAERAQEIEELAMRAVNSDIVRRAVASRRVWREVPVAAPVGGFAGSVHGFIDLLFEEEDGLVVVDYKTDSAPAEELPTVMERYRLQGGAYAYAMGEITGKHVKEMVFLYLQPDREERIPDLRAAMEEARESAESALRAG